MPMQAGKYFIGDLSYVMEAEWDEVYAIKDECSSSGGEFSLADGRKFAAYDTANGDGHYPCTDGSELDVDAGLIGCIRVEDIRDMTEDKIWNYGTIVEFPSEFSTSESNGKIRFGHICVDTSGEDEDGDSEDDSDDNE